MERSEYWRVYGKCWQGEERVWWPNGLAERRGVFTATPPVYYAGRFLQLENYLAVPTFRRLGHRPGI